LTILRTRSRTGAVGQQSGALVLQPDWKLSSAVRPAMAVYPARAHGESKGHIMPASNRAWRKWKAMPKPWARI